MRWILSFAVIMVCHFLSMAQTIMNPEFDRTDQPLFHIEKIEHTKDSTIVTCTLFVEDVMWANISPNTYLEDSSEHKKYRISRCEGLPFAPHQRTFSNSKKCNVRMLFPFCGDSDIINFIESTTKKSFNIYGISMKNSNEDTLENSIEQASLLSSKANYFFTIKDYEKATQYEEQAIKIKKWWFGKQSEEYEKSLFMLGIYYGCSLTYEKALKCFEEDIKIRAQLYGENTESYSEALRGLAMCYENLNRSSKAIPYYEAALKIKEETTGKLNYEYAQTKGLLAQSYYKIGDIPKAFESAREATELKKQLLGTHDEEFLISLLNLAQYNMWSDLNKSKELLLNIVDTTKYYYGREHQLYLLSTNALSQCLILLNKTSDAMFYAKENAEISLSLYGEQSIQYSLSMDLLSQIYEFMNDYDNAINCGKKSIQFVKTKIPAINLSTILHSIATCYAKKNDYYNALKFSREAIQVFKNIIIKDFDKLNSEQKYSLWRILHRIYDKGYPLYVANCMNKANIQDLYNNALFFKDITLNEDCSKGITWEMIKASLNDNDIAIEFIESIGKDSPNCYFALLNKKEYETPKMIKLFDASQFDSVLLKDDSSYGQKIKLGELIWGKVKEELLGVNNIYFSPVGMFHSIAIEDLPINEHTYYSDKYNLYRLSSTRQLVNMKEKKYYRKAMLFGGLNYNCGNMNMPNGDIRGGYDYLANTLEEVKEIAKILTNKKIESFVFNGLDGTEEIFKQFAIQNSEILHLATHGENIQQQSVETTKNRMNYNFLRINDSFDQLVYEKDALSWSFILLSGGNKLVNRENISEGEEDGILTALEISSMNLSNIDLVVLSACKTALGYNGVDNSVLGLQRGFKRAKANTILMSLDKVDDEATKILMVEFYRNLMDGKTKLQSLKNAQKYLRQMNNGKYDDPKYWASFIMLDGLN